MICPPCRTAGRLNRDANEAPEDLVAEAYRQAASETHAVCDKCCECQHMTGDWRNRRSDG